MKQLITFLALILAYTFATAQSPKIPPLVTKAFTAKFPSAQKLLWSENNNEYKATFDADGFHYEAKFNAHGDWKISQRDITVADLPPAVKTTMSAEYPGWSAKSAYILFLPGMITQYRVIAAKNESAKKSLLFGQDGKLLKDNFNL